MEYDTIRLSTEGPVATLTLNRPDALNAVSPRMDGGGVDPRGERGGGAR